MNPIFFVTAFLMLYALLGFVAVLFIFKRSKQPARRSVQFVVGLIGLVALYAIVKAFNNAGNTDSYHYFAIVVFMIVAAAASKYFRRKSN
jgi:peptidoglycan/LPS O-acetylase OafA/YrhL